MLRARILALFAGLAGAGASTGACAADPGDAPKSEDGGLPTSSDGSFAPSDAGGEPRDANGGGGDAPDASVPAVADSATLEPTPESGAPDVAVSDGPAPDAPSIPPSCTLCPLVVQYLTPTTGPTKEIQPHVEIANNGASDQDLTAITVRYWFTADGSQSQTFACDYALMGCGLVQAKFVTMTAPAAAADHYLELSFAGGSVASGASTGEIQARFHDTNDAVTFTQANDFSFNAADTAYARWNRITLYRAGTLVWGVEP